jgi:hypothetical protein
MSVSQMKVYGCLYSHRVGKKTAYVRINVGDKDAADAADRMLKAYLATHTM